MKSIIRSKLILITILILVLSISIFYLYDDSEFKEKYIYDVFHNDNNKLVVIMPYEFNPPKIEYKDSKNRDITFSLHKCPDKHTLIYEANFNSNYCKNIDLLINNKKVSVKVNKYPEFKDEIIMSTIVKNEDKYIKQWINFHMNFGIKRFIIYDNKDTDFISTTFFSKKSDLKKLLKNYISDGTVILIQWPYSYRLSKSGISGQTTQQNHSIYAFQNSKLIGLFDIDEYINIKTNRNDIPNFFNKLIEDKSIDKNNIGSFRLSNRSFLNPKKLPENGYNFLKIYTCDEISKSGREKNFVIPMNVKTFSVHKITSGKETYDVSSNDIYFNHYIFLNKPNRGREKNKCIDDSIKRHCAFINNY